MNAQASARERNSALLIVSPGHGDCPAAIGKMLHISPKVEVNTDQLNDISIFSPQGPLQPREHRKSMSQQLASHRSHHEVTCLDFVAAMKGDDTTRISKSSYVEELSSRTVGLVPVSLEEVRGPVACTVYCETCMAEVHSVLDFSEPDGGPSVIIRLWAAVAGCCGLPRWIEKFRVHKCPECGRILGKVTS